MFDQLKSLVLSLSIRQRILIVAAAIAVIGGLFWMSHWNKERDFQQLFGGLASDDAGAIVTKLKESGSEFRIQQNGGEILVPSAKVAELRLAMASAGLPKSGRIGYEIFDKTNFGQTDFAEQVNYRRALEGELERTVIAMQEIEQARVHLAFAKDSMFTDSKQPAKASVLVKLRPNATLAPANVNAITHLISSAVEGLLPEHVSVVDSKGKVLRGTLQGKDALEADATERNLEYKNKLEQQVLDKVNATLEPLLGAQRFRASVTAECDFTSGEQSEETLDPTKSVMVTSQRSEDNGTAAGNVAGVPGTQSNLPRPLSRPATGAGGVLNRRSESVAFQTSRLVKHLKLPQGTLKRLSVSVLVDQHVRWDIIKGKPNKVYEPLTAEQIKSVKDLVSGVVGLDTNRGDVVVVETIPFENTIAMQAPGSLNPGSLAEAKPGLKAPPEPIWQQQKYQMIAGGVLAGLLLLAGVLLFLRKGNKKKINIQVEVNGKPSIEGETEKRSEEGGRGGGKGKALEPAEPPMDPEQQAEEDAARELAREREVLGQIKLPENTTKKGAVLTRHIREEVKKSPDSVAHVVRTWINSNSED